MSFIRFELYLLQFLVFFGIQLTTAYSEDIPACTTAYRIIYDLLESESQAQKVYPSLGNIIKSQRELKTEESYCTALVQNLKDKVVARSRGCSFDAERLIQQAVLYEQFRLEQFLNSGVLPKRYFGFFDEQGDTASYEAILRVTIIQANKLTNEFAEKLKLESRISEQEVAFTFLAEGGALVLSTPDNNPNKIHPVYGAGLDNFRIGFKLYPELIQIYDQNFGTQLKYLLINLGKRSILLRPMTFREAVLGTTLMYLYEKELTADHLFKKSGLRLDTLPLRQQFILTSLMYNAGLLFSLERVEQIEKFATADYLHQTNIKSKRPQLPLMSPQENLKTLQQNAKIPQQLTSWSAVYHILQRYGAWVAVDQFSHTFANGQFVKRTNG